MRDRAGIRIVFLSVVNILDKLVSMANEWQNSIRICNALYWHKKQVFSVFSADTYVLDIFKCEDMIHIFKFKVCVLFSNK